MNKITTKEGFRINLNQILYYRGSVGETAVKFNMKDKGSIYLSETVEEFDQLIDLKGKTDLEKAFYHMVNQNPVKLSEEGLTEYENTLSESDEFIISSVGLDILRVRLKGLEVGETRTYLFKLKYLEL